MTMNKFRLYQSPYLYICFGVLFLIFAGIAYPFDLEYNRAVQGLAAQYHAHQELKIIRVIGKGEFVVFLALFFGIIRCKAIALRILTAFIIVSVIVWAFKIGVHRERPNSRDHFSFPSGDSGTSSCMAAVISAQLPVMAIPGAAAIASVAFLRTYDNYHNLSDVLAGIGFGLLSAGLSVFIKLRRCRFFWKIKPFVFISLYILLILIYLLPPLFNWAFLLWLGAGAIMAALFNLRKRKTYDNGSQRY